ncbi:uncharacterized protein LOC111124123 isoform X3 [Crassostrea virginica]
MVYVEEKNILNHYNCGMFKEGCPNTVYYSDEMYKYPACFEIEPTDHCYKAEVSCLPTTRVLTHIYDTTLSTLQNETSHPPSAHTHNGGAILFGIFLIIQIGLIIAIVAWKKKQRLSRCFGHKDFSEIEADIDQYGINVLLQRLPNDQRMFPAIAKKLSVPLEILRWSQKDRERFVKSMKRGKISVYSGRGMVIGCAEAGKTTLVKKLKGERDLNTVSTSGIEIHSHVFKLSTDESTINGCAEKEKTKGFFCLTQTMQKTPEGKKEEETSFTVEEEEGEIPDQINETSLLQTKQTDDFHVMLSSSNIPLHSNINENDEVTDNEVNHIDPQVQQPSHGLTVSLDMSEEEKQEQKFDISDGKASVNKKDLKMLSLLDFAGHSAYYACHHIFYSPRAFFILVIDMTKKLTDIATEACRKQDLIYSNWTYEDYVRYWLGSIHTYSSRTAPVILVFSHAEDNNAVSQKAQEFYYEICKCLPKELRTHVDKSRVFSIMKHSNKNIEDIKKCVASTVKSQSHWGEDVPISWTKLASVLKKLQKDNKIYLYLDLLRFVQNSIELAMENEEELVNALTFFHETGEILFQSETGNIILDLQWFVDAFKCIILDETHVDMKYPEFEELNENGFLSKKILDELWNNDNFYHHKKVLVNHMKKLDMLAELSEEMWYVPCMNKQTYYWTILENCNVSSRLCFLFEFLPFVIYHRLVVACINKLEMKPWISEGRKCIFHTVAILSCKDPYHRVLIGICDNNEPTHKESPYSIEIQINVTEPREIDTKLTSEVQGRICEILSNLTQAFTSRESSFSVGYRCRLKPFGANPDGQIIKEAELSESEFDCSKCRKVHLVDVRSIRKFWETANTTDKKSSAYERNAVGAIEFGTTCSGFAYNFKPGTMDIVVPDYHGGEYPSKKVPTTLLLKPDQSFCKFGFEAEDEYAGLADEEKRNYFFFKRFMPILKSNRTDQQRMCIDETGKEVDAQKILTICIRYMIYSLLEHINKKIIGSYQLKDINIVLTHPDICNDTAKISLTKAAQKCGIQKDQLRIVLKSDAAFVYCQTLNAAFKNEVLPGFKFMVIDIGGETTAISVHEMVSPTSMKWVIMPEEIPWGGNRIDDAFWQFFCNLLGEGNMKRFHKENNADYLKFFRGFEVQKSKRTSGNISISIPSALSEILDNKISEAISSSRYKDVVLLNKKTLKCKIQFRLFKTFFKETCENIQSHLQKMWNENDLTDVQTVLLVGGFAECYTVENMMREHLKLRGKRLILPTEPGLAVLKGAIYMGHVPDVPTTA